MTSVVVDFFIFSGCVIALLISAGELVQKDKTLVDYLFSASFMGLSLWYVQLGIYSTGVFRNEEFSYYLMTAISPVAFLTTPLMVNRYLWIITNRYAFRRKYFLVLIPALFAAAAAAMPVFFSGLRFSDSTMFYGPVMSDGFRSLPGYFRLVYLLVPFQSIFLVAMMVPVLVRLYSITREGREPGMPNVSAMGYRFASLITLSNIMAVAGVFWSLNFMKFAILFSHLSMISVYLVTQRHPDYHRLLKSITRKHQYTKSQIRGLDVSRIINRIYELMDDEKIYADEDLTLPEMATELGISQHQLSEILNRELKKNFSSFINEYRVREAKELLLEQPERSILSVGVAAGFNSATTFNSAFSKAEGLSPGKYRKMHLPRKKV